MTFDWLLVAFLLRACVILASDRDGLVAFADSPTSPAMGSKGKGKGGKKHPERVKVHGRQKPPLFGSPALVMKPKDRILDSMEEVVLFGQLDANRDRQLDPSEIEEKVYGYLSRFHMRLFRKLDTDHDGYVHFKETSQANFDTTAFKNIDRDNDGAFSREDVKAYTRTLTQNLTARFAKTVDLDHDGSISKAEFSGTIFHDLFKIASFAAGNQRDEFTDKDRRHFAALDRDGDGFHTLPEILAHMQRSSNYRAAKAVETIQKIGADRDGVVTRAEYMSAVRTLSASDTMSQEETDKLFDLIDTNRDGQHSRSELDGWARKADELNRTFAERDHDNDGKVSVEEWMKHLSEL